MTETLFETSNKESYNPVMVNSANIHKYHSYTQHYLL